jgi:hypothetical protein
VIGLVAIVILVLALNGSGMSSDDQIGTAAAQIVAATNILPSPTGASTETRSASPTYVEVAAAPPIPTYRRREIGVARFGEMKLVAAGGAVFLR